MEKTNFCLGYTEDLYHPVEMCDLGVLMWHIGGVPLLKKSNLCLGYTEDLFHPVKMGVSTGHVGGALLWR